MRFLFFLLLCYFLPFGAYCILPICLGLLSGLHFLINILSLVFIHQKKKNVYIHSAVKLHYSLILDVNVS